MRPAPSPVSTDRVGATAEGARARVRVAITSLTSDRLNTNHAIRDYLDEGFREVLDPGLVASCPLEEVERTIRAFEPDLIVAVGSLARDETDLGRLRRSADAAGSRLAFWLHEDPYEFDYAGRADVADVVFSNDPWSAAHYRHPRAHHLPLAASPRHHLRTVTPCAERSCALFFCGVGYPNRVDVLRRAGSILRPYPVAVLGAGWPSDLGFAENRRLTQAEMSDGAQGARLTLNLGRDFDIANRRLSLPSTTPGPRTFEVALAGSAQLYLATDLDVLTYFEKESEIVLIDGLSDIAAALERAYDEPDAIDAIARRAQARALRDHCYRNRARRILELCAA